MTAGDVCDGCLRSWEELGSLTEAEDGSWYCGECVDALMWGDVDGNDQATAE